MPIDVYVKTVSGDTIFVVWDSLQTQNFQLTVNSEPLYMELDKNNWILKKVQDPISNPTFDHGILLVNGVSFDNYGSQIIDAYQNLAFWGDFPISFWDCFEAPPSGYPSTLPIPLGHGRVPSDFLGQFSTVIWVGNNYLGDLEHWRNTPIIQYLQAGGNVLLMTRYGQSFIGSNMQEYLGINWIESSGNTIYNCVSSYPGLKSMSMIATQSSNAVFSTSLTNSESSLLFEETSSFSDTVGLGVWRKPVAGGTLRSEGGQFVFLSGRPYRYDSSSLRSNVEFILENFFLESITDINSNADIGLVSNYKLKQNYPNPFNPATTIQYQISENQNVKLQIYNIMGKLIKTLVDSEQNVGYHSVIWNGKDNYGQNVASGIYIYKLQAGSFVKMYKLNLLK